jgi:hypothetical protein
MNNQSFNNILYHIPSIIKKNIFSVLIIIERFRKNENLLKKCYDMIWRNN